MMKLTLKPKLEWKLATETHNWQLKLKTIEDAPTTTGGPKATFHL